MEDLIIIGAGGSSREIASSVEEINEIRPTWNLLGFLDDSPASVGQTLGGVKVLGPVSSVGRYSAHFIVGIASPRGTLARHKIVQEMGLPRHRFATIVHPGAKIHRSITIGSGSAILPNTVITHDCKIGDHTLIHSSVLIGHDSDIADFVTISPGAIVSGNVTVHPHVYIGSGAMIRDHVTIQSRVIIGLGAVVVKDISSGQTMVGNPAYALSSRAGKS